MARLSRILRCRTCGGALGTIALTRCDPGSDVTVRLEIVCMRKRCKRTEGFEMRFVNAGPVRSGTPLPDLAKE